MTARADHEKMIAGDATTLVFSGMSNKNMNIRWFMG